MHLNPKDPLTVAGQMARNVNYSELRVSESGEGFPGKIPTVAECEDFNRRASAWLDKREGWQVRQNRKQSIR
jgi:hypothetical protein